MKQLLIIAIASLIAYGCSQSNGTKTELTKDSKPRMVMALYDTGVSAPVYQMAGIFRIVKDSIKFVKMDESTFKKQLTVDTSYYIPVKKVFKDKAGKDSAGASWVQILNHRILVDAGPIDSVIAKYKQK